MTDKSTELIDKYLAGLASDKERAILLEWYRSVSNNEAEIWLDNPSEKEALKQSMLCDLQQQIAVSRRPEIIPIRRRKKQFYRGVAAAVLIMGTVAAIVVSSRRQSSIADVPNASSEILPGGDRAILKLSDGTTIILDSAANGVLAQQGNSQVIKLAGGKIAYDLKNKSQGEILMNAVSTPRGGKYQVVLPDGTKVWLNATSSITYPAAFTGSARNVKITGEVYFEVAQNKKQPFFVDVDGKSLIEVLGTDFNVNSYMDDENIKATLLKGSVRVVLNPGNALVSNLNTAGGVVLKPGQQAVVQMAASSGLQRSAPGISVRSDADIDQIMAWKNGYFSFDDLDIKSVMRCIERWYDVDVVYEGAVPVDKLMGKLPMNASIQKVLGILGQIGISFRLDGKKIIVTK